MFGCFIKPFQSFIYVSDSFIYVLNCLVHTLTSSSSSRRAIQVFNGSRSRHKSDHLGGSKHLKSPAFLAEEIEETSKSFKVTL